jgi:citrate lyase subunit beta/citryl-CoA lyase
MSGSFDLGPAILFCPADRPDRYAKALARADAVILDLEDAVAPDRKDVARQSLVDNPIDPARTIVRINGFRTSDAEADLAALRRTAYRYVMLPKTSDLVDFDVLAQFAVIALCETAEGVMSIDQVARAAPVVALMWGAEDLVASMGGSSSRGPDGRYRPLVAHARAMVAFAAAAHDRAMIDAVHLDIADVDGLAEEARDAAALGFAATACIHPDQVDVIRDAYRPSEADVARARATLAAAAQAGGGVFAFEGRMVDGPVLRHAEAVIRRAGT